MEREFENFTPGDEVFRLVKPAITKVQLVRYAGASGDFNPLHTDDEIARAAGFDGVVGQGMLTMAFLTQAVTKWVPRRQFRNIKIRFRGATNPGDIITIIGRIKDKRTDSGEKIITCTIEGCDQNDNVKASGTCEVFFPP